MASIVGVPPWAGLSGIPMNDAKVSDIPQARPSVRSLLASQAALPDRTRFLLSVVASVLGSMFIASVSF